MDGSANTAKDYLRRPYARVLTPDEEYGGYTAEILEFSGCVTEGDTASEALENLEAAAEAWIEAALDMGHEIPEPSDFQEYSGRIALRLPRTLHGRAIQMAEREGTSLNQFLVATIAERVGAGTLYARLTKNLDDRLRALATTSATVNVYMQNPLTSAFAGSGDPFEPHGSSATAGRYVVPIPTNGN